MKLPLLSSFADLALVASVLGLSHDRGHTQSRHIVLWDSKENQNAVVDALIIGGGPGGLAVAAALARQRHSSRIFDSGEYRNAKAKEMHNVLGWDGANPADYRKKARDDLLRNYPELVVYIPQSVTGLNTLEDDGAVVYTAVTDRGQIFQGRKVVFAQGMTEKFPDIKGYEDCWAHGMYDPFPKPVLTANPLIIPKHPLPLLPWLRGARPRIRWCPSPRRAREARVRPSTIPRRPTTRAGAGLYQRR